MPRVFLLVVVIPSLLVVPAFGQSPRQRSGTASHGRTVKSYPIEEFLRTTNFGGGSFSPDKRRILVSGDQSGVYNAYAIPIQGGEPQPLTDSKKESIFAIGYFPSDERFLYSSNQGGNELDHIYVRGLDGSVRDLTPGENLKAVFRGWSLDDESFFIGTNERDQRFFDVYEYQVVDFSRERIYENTDGRDFAAISPDNQTIALSKTHTRDDSDIYLYDVVSREMTLLTAHEGDVNHAPQTFSPDGTSLYFLTDKDSEFRYLVRQDLESGERQTVNQPNWDIAYANFSKRGKYLIVAVNRDARTALSIFRTATMERAALPEFDGADLSSVYVSRDESKLAIYVSSGRIPRDLYYYDFSPAPARRLTRSLSENIESEDLVEGEVVRFSSFDGLEIPGILYKPHQASAENKVPALVWVHGGPGGQSRVGYGALIQYLVNHGYAVYAINNRGSSGYGKSFQQLDDRQHGEGDLDDCVASKKMLANTGYVDSDKIGIIGGSYGGYMVLAALTFRPDEFAAGVDIFGISNWQRTLQNIPPWWESMRTALSREMGDFDDDEYLKSISPIFFSQQIRRPLMVLQGANDPRVLKVESDEIVAAVKKNGIPVTYLVFDDEGHGFLKKKNQENGYRSVLQFLDTHLKN